MRERERSGERGKGREKARLHIPVMQLYYGICTFASIYTVVLLLWKLHSLPAIQHTARKYSYSSSFG